MYSYIINSKNVEKRYLGPGGPGGGGGGGGVGQSVIPDSLSSLSFSRLQVQLVSKEAACTCAA